jgi:phosphate transport system substrate-binding protein
MQLAESFKIKVFGAIAVSLLLSVSAYGATKQEMTSIKIDSSSTVYPITQKVIEEWKTTGEKNLDIELDISGTGGGFRQFCRGETDINNASRPIQREEMKLCQENGVYYIELPVAFDALTFDLTLPELQRRQAEFIVEQGKFQ